MVVYGERPLIPASLRPQVLDILHAGHSGASTMKHRSAQSVFWPGITAEIEQKRASCRACVYRAPSQAAQPPQSPAVPEYPFAQICCDFFQVNGVSYLATVDIQQLAGGVEIQKRRLQVCDIIPQELLCTIWNRERNYNR